MSGYNALSSIENNTCLTTRFFKKIRQIQFVKIDGTTSMNQSSKSSQLKAMFRQVAPRELISDPAATLVAMGLLDSSRLTLASQAIVKVSNDQFLSDNEIDCSSRCFTSSFDRQSL